MDPITGDTILGEQTAAFGYPAKWIKIADDVSAGTTDLPDIGAIAIQTGSGTADRIQFSGNFPFAAAAADALGLLVWYTNAGTNQNQMRKLVSVVSANNYNVNADWGAAPTASHTYRLLIDCFRFNAMLIKTEFSSSSTSATCTIQPHFFSVPQDNAYPTPAVATPKRYPTRAYTIANTGISTDTTDVSATHYHGEVLSLGVHGAVGASLRVTAVSTGTVSVWVALV